MSSYAGNTDMSTFKYNQRLQKTSIRLLKVVPDPDLNLLTIQLVEVDLGKAEFEALSYVWGDQTKKITIDCNGKRLEIGANLYSALHERRRRNPGTALWADQVCINQDDVEEKTCQVRLMSTIYAKANQVIVWLGEQEHGDLDGLHLMEDLYEKCHGKQYDANAGIFEFHNFDYKAKGVPNPAFNPTWNSLFKILSNPWFGRVWVVQELLSAQKSVIWKGSLDLNTHPVLWTAMLIGRHKNLYENYDISMGSPQVSALMARNIAASYFDTKTRGPRPIYDTLSRYSGMSATEPRDRFFALVGVSTGLDEAFVDYTKTFEEVACLVGKMTLLGTLKYGLAENGTELLILENSPGKHRFPIEWLAFHANPQNHVSSHARTVS
ncbi:heterokaryon incompatibility protein-domain-containing protein [Phaeosphaeria sp. MPI-PUGE-AT-0046c]|nr:heterokaryon incompatibility protein-domain-containing protein [Phaeosphaeria sp. MPI-PUGE-AT-0046c]